MPIQQIQLSLNINSREQTSTKPFFKSIMDNSLNAPGQTSSSLSVKICRVCGAKAIGFNFGCPSCQKCKSFFRRNVEKYDTFFCPTNSACMGKCTKCRLDKCFEAGMCTRLLYSRLKIDKASNIERFIDTEIMNKLLHCDILANTNDTLLCSSKGYFQMDPYFIELNDHEKRLLLEIEQANQAAGFNEEECFDVTGECTDFDDAITMAQHYIRKVIKFAKGISAFRSLKQEDQLVIVKGFFSEMMLLLIAYIFNPEIDALSAIKEENATERVLVNLNVINCTSKADWSYYLLQKCHFVHQELENDAMMRDLISTILLFQPREHVSCPEFLQYNYMQYFYLGNRYLEHKFRDPQKAMAKVNMFLELKKELGFIKELFESLFIEDCKELPLVLLELFSK